MTRQPSDPHRAAPELVRIRPRPSIEQISRGRSVLSTTREGLVVHADHGLFIHETRLLSRWCYRIDGDTPRPNAYSVVRQDQWLGYYLLSAPGVDAPPIDDGSGMVPAESRTTLELRVMRHIDDGLTEEIALTNYTNETTSFVFSIDVDADFADNAEVHRRRQSGTRTIHWNDERLTFDYRIESLHRAVEIAAPGATYDDHRLTYAITLGPKEQWCTTIRFTAFLDDKRFESPPEYERRALQVFADETTKFESPQSTTITHDVLLTLEQARADLASLRLFDLDRDLRAWTVAAGVPLYVALFGRDTLTTGWQAGILGPDIMTGTLDALAKLQGTRVDDWRDEQPGRMLHEAHTGPLSMLDRNPRRRSYSSITTSRLYAFITAELWHWTGDKNLVRPFIEPALRALQWCDRYGDLDGDGFSEYKTRSPMAPVHQGWKDSPDAIVYEDGAPVEPPIATCEEQAFLYIAKLHLAETLFFLGERDLARKLHHEASELKKRFNDAFWMEDEGFFALALDSQKRQVRSIASNAGHCIAAAISDASLVERVVDRLFEPDLFSGWGIRTLSADHPRYNPYSYHLGSIWPVEHGTFALGMWRYGLYDRMHQIARAQFDAAALFEYHRLPELFGGHPRDAQHPFPGLYPNANPLQAWSSSSVFLLLQAMLGLYPYAPLKMLIIDPHLPPWLPEITLRDLRVGKATVTIRFRRGDDGRTRHRILEKRGKLHVVRQATPWSLTAEPPDRLHDILSSLIR